MEKFEPIVDKDEMKMRNVPHELCRVDVQNKFIHAKRNVMHRHIQTMIEAKTLESFTPRRKV